MASITKILEFANLQITDGSTATENSTFKSIGIDSLDFIDLISDIEKEYKLTIPDENLGKFKTIKDIADYIDEQPLLDHHQELDPNIVKSIERLAVIDHAESIALVNDDLRHERGKILVGLIGMRIMKSGPIGKFSFTENNMDYEEIYNKKYGSI